MKFIDYHDEEDDMREYFELMEKAEDKVHKELAVGSRCLPIESTVSQVASFVGWSALYSARSIFSWGIPDPKEDGLLFQAMFPFELFKRAVLMKHESFAKDKESSFKGELGINKLIYVPKSLNDELTIDNLQENKIPEMIQDELELPFTVDRSEYDPDSSVKVRIISKNDWGRVNWETGELFDSTAKPAYVDRIIINVHGGSWIAGSSATDLFLTSQIAQKTGYPMF